VRHTNIRLKRDVIIHTALQVITASNGIFDDCNAVPLKISFGQTPSLKLDFELAKKRALNIVLEKLGMDIHLLREFSALKQGLHLWLSFVYKF
jgi:hypothetical protein